MCLLPLPERLQPTTVLSLADNRLHLVLLATTLPGPAAAAGEPVVYVAFGTVVFMPKHLALVVAAGLAQVKGVRFLWSLPQVRLVGLALPASP